MSVYIVYKNEFDWSTNVTDRLKTGSIPLFMSVFSAKIARESINIIYKRLTIGLVIWMLHCLYRENTHELERCILTVYLIGILA